MKKILFLTSALLTLTACQAANNDAEINALRADVDALKIEVFGDPLAQCPEAEWLKDISAYANTLTGLPSADLAAEEWHEKNGEREDVMTSPSGLQYMVVKTGNADAPSPESGELVSVNYHGFFINGDKFDSSYDRGEPAEFPSNRVIPGWVEALQQMKPCEARTLYIPAHLAYGEKGRSGIPGGATLLFNVQLLNINP